MTTTLPYELLTQILEQARYRPAFEDPGDRERQLCRYSLVAKAWKAPAQELLWRNVTLVSPTAGENCSASAALGRYSTRSLSCEGVKGKDVMKIVKACRGLKELGIGKAEKVPAALLGIRALAGLTSLSLYDEFPFQLHRLGIHYVDAALDFFHLLATHSPVLTQLNLGGNHRSKQVSLILSHLVPQLLLLELPVVHYPGYAALDAVVLEQLGRCDRLQELIINAAEGYWYKDNNFDSTHPSDCGWGYEYSEDSNYALLAHPAPSLLAALPPTSSIEILRTRYGHKLALAAIEDLIEALELPAMKRMRTLYFAEAAEEEELTEELEDYCEERGTEVLMTEKTKEELEEEYARYRAGFSDGKELPGEPEPWDLE